MKIDARQAGRLLAAPVAVRAILLHGEDHGLIRERAAEAVRAAAGSLDDPFRIAVLDRDRHDRLEEEATALSLTGGRRVVWVREATDQLHAALARLLPGKARDAPPPGSAALIVIEAGALPARAKLRALIEAAPEAASIACYPEGGRALEGSIARMLQAERVGIDPDALGWLASRLGADRAAGRGEVEKLALYAGSGGRLTLDDVQAVTLDAAGASLEEAAFAATAGDRAAADLAIERALSEGLAPVALARALLSHLHRLRQTRLLLDGGASQSDAMARLRPPVFFKRSAQFSRALGLWSAAGLFEAAVETSRLESACKQTGAPDQVLARRHIAMLAARAAARQHRRS
ncbi:DNA polymerase III subunit delta [Lichenicoccus sp.]|uniref:DNA polymerase III subunit delta n=1 Tax=Lichenicoccus sp. TaxID=2781899 RepID=UPI003D122E0F